MKLESILVAIFLLQHMRVYSFQRIVDLPGGHKLDLVDIGESVTEIKITSHDFIFLSFVKTGHSHLMRSGDNGNSWISVISDMPSIREIEEDQLGNIYVAGNGLYKSINNGNNWEILYNSSHVFDVIFPDTNSIVIGISTDFPGSNFVFIR